MIKVYIREEHETEGFLIGSFNVADLDKVVSAFGTWETARKPYKPMKAINAQFVINGEILGFEIIMGQKRG